MNEPKHTPGPWDYRKLPSGAYIVFHTYDKPTAGFIYQEPNARLIAAAPELLEALKQALDALGGNDPNDLSFEDDICGYIRAAIYKAEGREP